MKRKHNMNLIIVILFNKFVLISQIPKNSLRLSHSHHINFFLNIIILFKETSAHYSIIAYGTRKQYLHIQIGTFDDTP